MTIGQAPAGSETMVYFHPELTLEEKLVEGMVTIFHWLVYWDSSIVSQENPQHMEGSIIPQLIINQQGF